MFKRLLRHPATLALGASVLGAYLVLALRTTRWTVHAGPGTRRHIEAPLPAVVVFWHERLPLMPALWLHARAQRRGREPGRMHVLVSRHQDGRLIGRAMASFGVATIHGSSAAKGRERGGAAGLRAMLAALTAGDQVAITPDGPRGPRRSFAPGAAQLAALAGVPVIPCAGQSTRRRVLPTWDRMVLPLPFGRGVLVCGEPVPVPRDGWEESVPALQAALTDAADRADALCAG